jgi:mRNA-degrading endonuclease RelE of RelBE toxin-antitoxin system
MYYISYHQSLQKEDFDDGDLPEDLQEDFINIYKRDLSRNPYPGSSKVRKHILPNKPLAGYYAVDITWSRKLKDKAFREQFRIVYDIDEKNKRVTVFSFDRHDIAYDKAKERTRSLRSMKKQNL